MSTYVWTLVSETSAISFCSFWTVPNATFHLEMLAASSLTICYRIKTPTIHQIHQKLYRNSTVPTCTYTISHTHTKINRFYIRLVTTKSTKSSSFEASFTKINFLCARIFWHVFHKLTVHNQKILYLCTRATFAHTMPEIRFSSKTSFPLFVEYWRRR